MDPHQHPYYNRHYASLDTSSHDLVRPQTASSSRSPSGQTPATIPQTQWGSVPTASQPPGWNPSAFRDKPLPNPPSQSFSSSVKRKKRPGSLRARTDEDREPDTSMLYPKMTSYDLAEAPRSAPHDQRSFSASARASPNNEEDEPYPSALPRSPTYPGASTGRLRSPSESTEAALKDEEDYGAFMQATTGLGPMPTFRQNSVIDDTWRQQRAQAANAPIQTRNIVVSPVSNPASALSPAMTNRFASVISPVAETPMAYAPYSRSGRRPFEAASTRRLTPPIDISDSGLGGFDRPRLPAAVQAPTERDQSWMTANDLAQPDEELPTYASSQAQAQQSQRVEAARRAQELQRRWREGGRKYGPDV